MLTVPSSFAESAYTGTSAMSMYGDFPGLSNFGPGVIGSCQYSTRRPVAGSISPGFWGAVPVAALVVAVPVLPGVAGAMACCVPSRYAP